MSFTQKNDPSDDDRDVELMLAVKEQNALAFEELMARNQQNVASLLTHFMGSQDLAEDLTQEVFLRVYKARENYQPSAKFSTWLFRIVHNVALNAMRTRRRHPEVLFGALQSSDSQSGRQITIEETLLAQSGLIPIRALSAKEIQQVVRQAIDSLSVRQREAILLHRFQGMRYDQIGEVMNLSPSAVKSVLCRARLALRDRLAPYFEEPRGEEK